MGAGTAPIVNKYVLVERKEQLKMDAINRINNLIESHRSKYPLISKHGFGLSAGSTFLQKLSELTRMVNSYNENKNDQDYMSRKRTIETIVARSQESLPPFHLRDTVATWLLLKVRYMICAMIFCELEQCIIPDEKLVVEYIKVIFKINYYVNLINEEEYRHSQTLSQFSDIANAQVIGNLMVTQKINIINFVLEMQNNDQEVPFSSSSNDNLTETIKGYYRANKLKEPDSAFIELMKLSIPKTKEEVTSYKAELKDIFAFYITNNYNETLALTKAVANRPISAI